MKLERKYLEDYIENCKNKRLSKHTLKAYQIDLIQYYEIMEKYQLEDDKRGLNEYIKWLNQHYKSKTVKRKIASLNAFFAYSEYEEIIDVNPLRKMHIPIRLEKTLPKIISKQHLKSMLDVINQQSCKRDIAIIDLLISTGIRVSELCSLKDEDIDLHEGTIMVHGKGKKERLIYLGDQVMISLKNYEKQREEGEYYFMNKYHKRLSEQSIRNLVKACADKAGVEKHITPHQFRHTFASMLLQKDVDIRNIQQILGHSSITTTQIYTHISNHQQKEILMKKNPRDLI